MSDRATIRRVTGGYILTVSWPLAGSPISGGEMVCTTFAEAVTLLYRDLHPECRVGTKVRVIVEEPTPCP